MRLINADELIRFYFDDEDGNKTFEFVPAEFIDNAPTIDAEPTKHGHWKWNKQYGTECSECGTAMFEVIGHIFSSATPKYCPYCGAKMDEVGE